MIWLNGKTKQYKANLHSHSTVSDGKLTPSELVSAYKSHGYSILAITDHEAPVTHNDFTTPDFLILNGYEAYIRPSKLCTFNRFKPEIHLNLIAREPKNDLIIGYEPAYCKYLNPVEQVKHHKIMKPGSREFSIPYIQAFIDTAVENGYLVSLNHPCWSMQATADVLKLRGYYSMEIFNYSSMTGSEYAENMPVYDMVLRSGCFPYCHGSDDNHNKKDFSDPLCDSFGAWTMIESDSLDYKSVISSLESGRFYASTGPAIKSLTYDESSEEINISTSPARKIIMHMTPKYSKVAYDVSGNTITSASFKFPHDAEYVYFSVIAEDGTKAYTHSYKRK